MGRQEGFSLIECTVVILLMTLAAILGAGQWAQKMEDEAADATSSWLASLHAGLEAFLVSRVDQLTGLSNPSQAFAFGQPDMPRIHELKQAGFLSAAFPAVSPHAAASGISVLPSAGCNVMSCRAEAMAWSQPWPGKRSDQNMLQFSSRVLSGLNGKGLVVSPLAPDRVRGPLGDFPNPPLPGMSAWPVGTVAVLAHHAVSADDRHVRRMDPRQTHLRGGLVTDAGLSAAHIRSGNAIESGGRLTAGEYLMIRGKGQEGQPCPEDGLIGRGIQGGLLVCDQGSWKGQESHFGGAYAVNSMDQCGKTTWLNLPWWNKQKLSAVNPKTGQCTCPSGYQAVMVSSGGDRSGPPYWTTGYVCIR